MNQNSDITRYDAEGNVIGVVSADHVSKLKHKPRAPIPGINKPHKFACDSDCIRYPCEAKCDVILAAIPGIHSGMHHRELSYNDNMRLAVVEELPRRIPGDMSVDIPTARLLLILAGIRMGIPKPMLAVQFDVTLRRLNQIVAEAKGQ